MGVIGSSAEAKLRTMAFGICELNWLKMILKRLEDPMLYYDNKATINISHNLVHHDIHKLAGSCFDESLTKSNVP